MNKHLYEENGTGTNGNNELSIKVKNFVDDVYNTFSDYPDDELELYIMEDIMAEFCHRRIKRRCEIIKGEIEKEKESNNDN